MVSSKVKTALDYLPLIVFFVVFKWLGMPEAIAAMVVVTLIAMAALFVAERKIAPVPLITSVLVVAFGGLSLWFNNDTIYKMKPTAINLLFAVVLFIGCIRKKGLLSYVMGASLQLTDRGWWLLSRRFAFFFTAMAALNELVWRSVPTEWWVDFKVFGLLGITVVFTMFQMGFIQAHLKPEDNQTNA